VLCGAGRCEVACTGMQSCNGVSCGNSCACDVACPGAQSCEGVTCTALACKVSLTKPGCTSEPEACHSCQ
jgi:hypothetical protein